MNRTLPFLSLLAPTGSAKAINLPIEIIQQFQALIHIAVMEPRIVMYESLAAAVAKIMNQTIGITVCYSTGSGKMLSQETERSITYMTPTSLFPQFRSMIESVEEREALPYRMIIIDEIHKMDQVEVMVPYSILKNFILTRIAYHMQGRYLHFRWLQQMQKDFVSGYMEILLYNMTGHNIKSKLGASLSKFTICR